MLRMALLKAVRQPSLSDTDGIRIQITWDLDSFFIWGGKDSMYCFMNFYRKLHCTSLKKLTIFICMLFSI